MLDRVNMLIFASVREGPTARPSKIGSHFTLNVRFFNELFCPTMLLKSALFVSSRRDIISIEYISKISGNKCLQRWSLWVPQAPPVLELSIGPETRSGDIVAQIVRIERVLRNSNEPNSFCSACAMLHNDSHCQHARSPCFDSVPANYLAD